MKIEDLWALLRREGVESQRRVDATHPLPLYADYEFPDKLGLLLICDERPNDATGMHAIRIERRQRLDGRWSMRVLLEERRLLAVFTELCRDIVEFTRENAGSAPPSALVLSRIARWRSLMQAQPAGLTRDQLRGLIGELLVLEELLLPALPAEQAVLAWTGPLGASQDFHLPDGRKLEVKAVATNASSTRINGLAQLDGGGASLQLVVVRLEDSGPDAEGAITAGRLIARLRLRLEAAPVAVEALDSLLGFVGWAESAACEVVAVRLDRIECHPVTGDFPRLTLANVPSGVVEATYDILLPKVAAIS